MSKKRKNLPQSSRVGAESDSSSESSPAVPARRGWRRFRPRPRALWAAIRRTDFKRVFHDCAPAMLGGLLGGLAYDPFCLVWLIPFAPMLLFATASNAPTPRSAFFRTLSGSFVFYAIGIHWLMTTGRYHPAAPLGVAFVMLYMAAYPALAGAILRRWFSGLALLPRFAVFGSLWLLGEWFRTLGRLAMPLTQLGHAWATRPVLIQWADHFGELGISAQVLLVSGFLLAALRLAATFLHTNVVGRTLGWLTDPAGGGNTSDRAASTPALPSSRPIGIWLPPALLLIVCGAVFAISAWRLGSWEDEISNGSDVTVAALQPNIDQDKKLATNMLEDDEERARLVQWSYDLQLDLARDSVPKGTDLVVMPESTFSEFGFTFDSATHTRIEQLSRAMDADLLFGADRLELTPDRRIAHAFNAAWFLPRGAGMAAARQQDKMRLVPFGESIPYFDKIPFLSTLVGLLSFDEGRSINLFQTNPHSAGGEPIRHGSLICFESTFSASAADRARAGARFLTVITNDGWYGMSAGPAQHHNLSILRAVETRRAVVRSANTGISSIINQAGRITSTVELGRQGVASGRIKPSGHLTWFVRWGNTWLVAACLAVIALGVFAGRVSKKERAAG